MLWQHGWCTILLGRLSVPVESDVYRQREKPTVDFNCTVDHNCKFIHVGELFAGRFNDKTKVRFDKYVEKLRSGEFKDITFNYVDHTGAVHRETGPYVLCDNGYHKWKQTLAPCKTTAVPELTLWSKKVESTRKDVERTFGMTQRRFRILHYPFTLRDVCDIRYVVVTCFTFHNMLFDCDAQFDEHSDNDAMGFIQTNKANRIIFGQQRLVQATRATRVNEMAADPQLECSEEYDDEYCLRRENMANHMYYQYVHRNLIW